MGALQTPLNADPRGAEPPRVVAVAYSGGRDSAALLHATWHAARDHAEAGLASIQVVALHVHHGLSQQADAWLAHCEAQCQSWAAEWPSLQFRSVRLATRPAKGESIEAWARSERYRALAGMARETGASLVLMAHHRRDQAETFVLQAMRGAGPAGLSAMRARHVDEHGVVWARPWLEYPREAVEAYVRERRLSFIDDDSNADERFARNRFRLEVWPAWAQSFPGAEAALAQAAHRAQEAQACLNELAEMDLFAVAPSGPLRLAAWSALSVPRRSNALHAWLSRIPQARVTRGLLERLIRELDEGRGGPARWSLDGGELRRYRGELSFSLSAAVRRNNSPAPVSLVLRSIGDFDCPDWGGRLSVFPVACGGVAWSEGLAVTLRARQGSEQFQSRLTQPARCLKKQFQAAGVPEWERRAPLIFLGEALVFVPGLGVDVRVVAPAGVPQVGFRWEAV